TRFQTSQRIRLLEEDIIEIGGDIAGVPTGCLIGLDAGDELLDDYRRLNGSLTAAQHRERRVKQELDEIEREAISPPWPEPGRMALRRAFRYAQPGLVAHHRDYGWGIYLGRGHGGGVGLFLFDRAIRLINEYRHFDYLTDGKAIRVPDEIANTTDAVVDATTLLPDEELQRLWQRVKQLELPDLDALVAE